MQPAKLIYSDRLHWLFAVWWEELRDWPQRSKSEFSGMVWLGWWLYKYIHSSKLIELCAYNVRILLYVNNTSKKVWKIILLKKKNDYHWKNYLPMNKQEKFKNK